MKVCHKKNFESRSEVIRGHIHCDTNRHLAHEFIGSQIEPIVGPNFRFIFPYSDIIELLWTPAFPYPTPVPAEIRDVSPFGLPLK